MAGSLTIDTIHGLPKGFMGCHTVATGSSSKMTLSVYNSMMTNGTSSATTSSYVHRHWKPASSTTTTIYGYTRPGPSTRAASEPPTHVCDVEMLDISEQSNRSGGSPSDSMGREQQSTPTQQTNGSHENPSSNLKRSQSHWGLFPVTMMPSTTDSDRVCVSGFFNRLKRALSSSLLSLSSSSSSPSFSSSSSLAPPTSTLVHRRHARSYRSPKPYTRSRSPPTSDDSSISPHSSWSHSFDQSPVEEVSESQEREDDSSQPSASSSSESQAMMRASSLAPTEIDDPDADQLATLLTSHNIKIRDYAYVPSTRPPVAELFDQYEGIAEYEYRLRQRPRLYPITGKVLRRLLDIGWVTMDEVNSRCHAMDFEELRKADERPGGPYPYIVRWKEGEYIAGGILVAAPNSERQRVQVMEARREKWMRLDRVRRRMELEMESERVERERAEEVLRARRLQLRREMMERRKRSLGDIEEDSSSGPKRRKVEGDEVAEEEEFVESQNDYNVPDDFMDDAEEPALGSQQEPEPWTREYWDKQPGMAAFKPEKQYPAPLSEYDPEIYPEARSIIESQEQSQQRRGALLHHSPSPGPSSSPFAPSSSSPGAGPSTRPLQPAGTQPLVRTDTPPLEESQPSQPQHQMGPGLGKPNRGLKRTLSRTQTFSQL